MYRIVGIDPGTNFIGVSLLTLDLPSLDINKVETFLIDITKTLPLNNQSLITTKMRLLEEIILDTFNSLDPDRISIEDAYITFGRPRAYGALIKSTQAIERAFTRYSNVIRLNYYSPSNAKVAIGSKGRDKKEPVLANIKKISELKYDFDRVTDHEVDAVVLAYADLLYLRRNRIELVY